jgi:hypothetical protein
LASHCASAQANQPNEPGRAQAFDAKGVAHIVLQLLRNPQRGHSARFESADLTDVLRVALPDFQVFAVFYRWDRKTLTVITSEYTAQDLPARLAAVLSTPT